MEPVLRILYGPPGTGKTWRAAREAVRLLEPATAEDQLAARHKDLVDAGRIIWVTFHPSYAYEDFVEGLRPKVTDTGVTYEASPGPFLTASATASAPELSARFPVGSVIESSTNMKYEVHHVDSGSVVLKSLNDRGAGVLTPVSFWLVEQLMRHAIEPGALSIPGTKAKEQKVYLDLLGVDKQSLFGMTGPLRAVWEHAAAWVTRDATPTILVIDEINRADTARVFGELVTLLESDKRLGAANERKVQLPYSKVAFGVPNDLHVIGTMNTADRSLSLIDHALRRRFEFEEVAPDPQLCAHPYGGVDLRAILEAWNERIEVLLGRDLLIGHSYLMRAALERQRERSGFVDDADGQLRALAAVMRSALVPLLLEYFPGDPRKVDYVLGRDRSRGVGGLLEFRSVAGLVSAADDLLDMADGSTYSLPDRWNPGSEAWDADRFRSDLASALP